MLARATSNYNWAVDEQKRLDEVVSNRGAVDGPMLSTVRAAAAARVTEAELEKTFATAALARRPRLGSRVRPVAGTPVERSAARTAASVGRWSGRP